MRTPYGTPYATLRLLALHGSCPTLWDCEEAEREARMYHARKMQRLALQTLLIARALWSARRHLTQH